MAALAAILFRIIYYFTPYTVFSQPRFLPSAIERAADIPSVLSTKLTPVRLNYRYVIIKTYENTGH
jgi:hypothetical protein